MSKRIGVAVFALSMLSMSAAKAGHKDGGDLARAGFMAAANVVITELEKPENQKVAKGLDLNLVRSKVTMEHIKMSSALSWGLNQGDGEVSCSYSMEDDVLQISDRRWRVSHAGATREEILFGGDFGVGGTSASAGGRGGDLTSGATAARAPSGGTNGSIVASLGGTNGYAIVKISGSTVNISGNSIVGREVVGTPFR